MLRVLAVAALAKTAGALLAFPFLLDEPSIWNGSVPGAAHAVAVLGFGVPALLLVVSRDPASAALSAVVACSASAYATRPLTLIGWDFLAAFRIEGFAAFALWILVLDQPEPVRSPLVRRCVLAAAGWSAACGLFGVLDERFVDFARLWGARYHVVWDLTLPLALVAIVVLAVRSLRAGSDLGPILLVALGPLIVQLTLESLVPAYGSWAAIPGNRALLTGFLLAALLTLPIWLVMAPDRGRWETDGNKSAEIDSSS